MFHRNEHECRLYLASLHNTLFQAPNTTLNRPMTDTEICLLGSLSSIGGLLTTPTTGYIMDKLGKKNCCIMNSVALVLVWSLLTFTRNVETVLVAGFISGIASSVFIVTSVYISKISQESIRGSMTACNMISYGMGMMLSYLLGGFLEYHVMPYVGLTMSVAGTCALFPLKETPMHYLSKGMEREAAKSLAYYRMWKIDSKEVLEELTTMKRILNPDLGEKSRSSRRAFFVNFVVVSASIFQGLLVVQMYAEPIFTDVIPTMSPTVCSVLLALSTVLAGMVFAYLTDAIGRRPLMIYASLATGVSCVILGTEMQVHWGPSWLTGVFMYVLAVTYTCGAGTVPYVLIAELYLPEVKNLFSSILVEYIWLCDFVILFIFNPRLKALGWGPIFYVFATVCFLSSCFCIFFMPETNVLNDEEIQKLFTTKRKVSKLV